jgi:hypothetical protein
MSAPITPRDVLADGTDGGEFQERYVRKGSIRAAIENIKKLEKLPVDSPDRQVYIDGLRELAPALDALELLEHFAPRNPEVAQIIEAPADPERKFLSWTAGTAHDRNCHRQSQS